MTQPICKEAARRECPHCHGSLARYEDPKAVEIIDSLTKACAESEAQAEIFRKGFAALQEVVLEQGRRLQVMKEALEEFATETETLPCDDPQCGDSTWDHACTAGRRKPTKRAARAIAALSTLPVSVLGQEKEKDSGTKSLTTTQNTTKEAALDEYIGDEDD